MPFLKSNMLNYYITYITFLVHIYLKGLQSKCYLSAIKKSLSGTM